MLSNMDLKKKKNHFSLRLEYQVLDSFWEWGKACRGWPSHRVPLSVYSAMSGPSTVISLVTLPLNELRLNFTLPWKKSRQGMFVEGNEQERRYKNWSVCSASEAVRDDKNRWERNLPFIELSHGAGWWVNRKVKSNTEWRVVWQNPTNDALGTKKKRFTCSYRLRVGDRSSQLGKPNTKPFAQWIR